MSAQTLYIIGFSLVCLYIFTGIDDFIWDVITLIKRSKEREKILDFSILEETPPKLIALVIAAWHEDNVLYDVVENIIKSQQYPESMYHIFLGVYPNDAPTVYIAQLLESKYKNVHCVINYKDGPTSKAQNINYVISIIKKLEQEKDWQFATISVHDSEDLVHPYEFKVTNYLLDTYPAIQFPVFPLIKKPTFKNMFANITTNTYADEFAENHFITMVGRRNTGAFVPSAGTGFSLSRDTISVLGYHVLPENSLTEDYRLSLSLYENGLQMYYVLEKTERVDFKGTIKTEYIATRSMFPNTFKTAVRQKTRWTLGITMQSLRFKDIFNDKLSFVGKYSLYRDQKAKIGNLLSMVGYPVLIYFLISLFVPLTPIYPKYSLSWYLSFMVTIMMLERQIFRGVALYNIYGWRSVFFGCLFPPLLPLRIVWGNIINLVATIKAYIQFLKGKSKEKAEAKPEAKPEENPNDLDQKELNEVPKELNVVSEELDEVPEELDEVPKELDEIPKELDEIPKQEDVQVLRADDIKKTDSTPAKELTKFEWSKTEHSFLEKSILERFHRRFGGILIEKGYITPELLQDLLEEKDEKIFIGEYLLSLDIINENQYIDVLASVKNIPFLHSDSLLLYDLKQFAQEFEKTFLREYQILPILKTKEGYVFAYGSSSPLNTQSLLKETYTLDSQAVLALDRTVEIGISQIYHKQNKDTHSILDQYLDEEKITAEQIIIIRNYAGRQNLEESIVADKIGVCQNSLETQPLTD
ncbi:MAG: glycosyltransferase [Anaerocolumna sp.]